MSTPNTPVVTCLLDDGSGTFPLDISSQVSLSAGVDISGYGRADEASSASAAQLSLTVKNNDGSFTTGVGFGLGGFGSGFFGGKVPIFKGQAIRFGLTLGATYKNCFTGRIDSIGQTFTGAPGLRSDIQITALDAFSDYGKRPMRSMLEQEILLDGPTAYYTLGEAEGSSSAGDTSGHGQLPLVSTGTGTAVTFGTGIGPTDGLTAPTFANGQYLSALSAPVGTGSWSVAVFFSTTTTPGATLLMPLISAYTGSGTASNFQIDIDSTGKLNVQSGGNTIGYGGPAVTDGKIHSAVLTCDSATGFARIYLDGVDYGFTGLATSALVAQDLTVGWNLNPNHSGLGYPHFTGVVSHVAVFDGKVLSAARAGAYATALTGFNEATDARISRLASYAGTTAISATPSGQSMPTQPTSGQSLLDAMGVVSDAEDGVLFIDGSGQLRLQGRGVRPGKVAADLTLSGKALDPDSVSIVDDTQQAVNQMTVSRYNGATQTYPALAPATNVYPSSIDLVIDSDATALGRAQWAVTKRSSPGPRLPSATTSNLRTSPSAASVFAREIGDRLHFTGLPATTNPNLGDVTIEGWSMHLDTDSWTYTYNLLPWSLFQALVIDDPIYGAIDSYPVM